MGVHFNGKTYNLYVGNKTIESAYVGSQLIYQLASSEPVLSDFSEVVNIALGGAYDAGYEVKFSPNGSMIAIGAYGDNVEVYDTSDYSLIATLTEASNTITSLSWSANGDRIGYGYRSDGGPVYIHNTSDFSLVKTLHATPGLRAFAFSKDGRFIAAGGRKLLSRGDEYYALLYDADTYSRIHEWTGFYLRGMPSSVGFSPDGEHLTVSTSIGGQYWYVFDTGDYSELLYIIGANVFAYSDDGSVFAMVDDKTVRIYNVSGDTYSYNKVLDFSDVSYNIHAVDLSADGKYLVTGRNDRMRITEIATGNIIKELIGPRANDVHISNDGKYLAQSEGNIYKFYE